MIVIARKASIRGVAMSYKVRIDGQKVGKLNSGASGSFLVEPGRHVVQTRSGGTSSKKVTVDVTEGGYHVLGTGPTKSGSLMMVPAVAVGGVGAHLAARGGGGTSAFLLLEITLVLLFTAVARVPGLHITLSPIRQPNGLPDLSDPAGRQPVWGGAPGPFGQ